MEITIPEDVLEVLNRLATAAEDLRARADENFDLAKKSFDLQQQNAQLCREDLEFRREQAKAGEAEKQLFLRMFMPPGAPPADGANAGPIPAGDPGGIRRRRHPNT